MIFWRWLWGEWSMWEIDEFSLSLIWRSLRYQPNISVYALQTRLKLKYQNWKNYFLLVVLHRKVYFQWSTSQFSLQNWQFVYVFNFVSLYLPPGVRSGSHVTNNNIWRCWMKAWTNVRIQIRLKLAEFNVLSDQFFIYKILEFNARPFCDNPSHQILR